MSLPVDDLQCPVCCDIFTDPVLLSCSHSFCRNCVSRYWETSGTRGCPLCRKKSSKTGPTTNLALKNLCESVQEARRESLSAERVAEEKLLNCDLHAERLKLFCLVDKQPICVVCHQSKTHKNHECSTIQEALVDCKEDLRSTLASLQTKMDDLRIILSNSENTINYIENQAAETQLQIQAQFKQLHQALRREELARLGALKTEKEEKLAGMKDKIGEVSEEMRCLQESFGALESELDAEDMVLLQNFKAIRDRCNSLPLGAVNMSGTLIDVAKHLSNLKYSIWENTNDHLQYTPVTLDPNTAHPYLILSDDLTSVHYAGQSYGCPDVPERFRMSAEVVGMTALGAGSYHWTVETGSNQDWLLGVASVSAPRNVVVSARPENGFWTLCYRDGELRAMGSPPTTLDPPGSTGAPLCRVRVRLDYNRGTLRFFGDRSGYQDDSGGDDDDDDEDDDEDGGGGGGGGADAGTLLYTFECTFTEMLLPYFYTQSQHPLRILPEDVVVTALRNEVSK